MYIYPISRSCLNKYFECEFENPTVLTFDILGVVKNLFTFPKMLISFFSSPGGIPARNSRGERLLLYVGLLDILQSYRLKKKLEHAVKSMVHDGVSWDNAALCGEKVWLHLVIVICELNADIYSFVVSRYLGFMQAEYSPLNGILVGKYPGTCICCLICFTFVSYAKKQKTRNDNCNSNQTNNNFLFHWY